MNSKEQNDNENGNLPKWLKGLLTFIFTIAIGIFSFYFYNFHGPLGTQETLAQFGDFIGGTLNPFLGFATIFLLIWSINVQVKELKEARIAAEKSSNALSVQANHYEIQAKLNDLHRAIQIEKNALLKAMNEPMNLYEPKQPLNGLTWGSYINSHAEKTYIKEWEVFAKSWANALIAKFKKNGILSVLGETEKMDGFNTIISSIKRLVSLIAECASIPEGKRAAQCEATALLSDVEKLKCCEPFTSLPITDKCNYSDSLEKLASQLLFIWAEDA
ncbi:hypothetical protein [uncultured Shewanella sp.]|uniref:hypothetical protein n=1 Tax=uncultured Shewanella sp. TaxID=173975 RepID=UPI002613571D|nr:hypothetical protein [uncultured Shewanella sp.]